MRHVRLLSALALAHAVATASPAFAGACARPQIPTRPLTTDGAALVAGGGVVLATEDATKPPRWRFTNGANKVAAKPRAIGAGLVVLLAPPKGDWTLADDKGKPVLKIKHAAAEPKPLEAPKVAEVVFTSTTGRRGTSTNVTASISGEAPAGAVALVAFDDKGGVRSFIQVEGRAADPATKLAAYAIYFSGSCTVMPNGTVPTGAGDKIGLAWLDASGRLSPKTSITVKAAPLPAGGIGPGE